MARRRGLFDGLGGRPSVGGEWNKLLHPKVGAPAKPKASPKTPKAPQLGPNSTSVAPEIPGAYDPALDSQLRASWRGYGQLNQDSATAGTRSEQDRSTAVGLAQRNSDRTQADFQTQLTNLFHNFKVQGIQQGESANAAGVLHGGTQAASAEVRGGNLTRARQPIDTGITRNKEDLASRLADINLTASRGGEDRQTKLQRALAEAGYYGQDLRSEAFWQAQQNNPDLLSQLAGGGAKAPAKKKRRK